MQIKKHKVINKVINKNPEGNVNNFPLEYLDLSKTYTRLSANSKLAWLTL